MLKKRSHLALIAGISLISQTMNAASADIINTYKNSYGSVLKLSTASENRVHGTFTTAVASADCQKVIGVERPLIGYQVLNVVSFIIAYPECGSVLSFTGYINADNEIDMTALLSKEPVQLNSREFHKQFVSHTLFKPVKQA